MKILDNSNGLDNVYGNLWFFPVKLKAGELKTGHKHEFDHVHMVISGSATMVCYTGITDDTVLFKAKIEAGKLYRVPKEHVHSIEADQGEDYYGQCIHALRHENGDIVETDMIQEINEGNIEFKPNEPT